MPGASSSAPRLRDRRARHCTVRRGAGVRASARTGCLRGRRGGGGGAAAPRQWLCAVGGRRMRARAAPFSDVALPARTRAPESAPAPPDERMRVASPARDADSAAAAAMSSREMQDQAKAVEILMKKGDKNSQNQGGYDPNRSHNSMARVKNKQPAPVQITAEQLLREARERQEEDGKPPKQKITDPDELAEYARCARARACVRACVRACERACVRACVRARARRQSSASTHPLPPMHTQAARTQGHAHTRAQAHTRPHTHEQAREGRG